MVTWQNYPTFIENILTSYNKSEIAYKYLEKMDITNLVMCIFDVLQSAKIQTIKKKFKSNAESENFRIDGNEALLMKQYKNALIYYNSALTNAKINSREMKLAYSARSKLFFELKLYSACLSDVNKSLSLNYPEEELELLKRKTDCLRYTTLSTKETLPSSDFGEKFFCSNFERHSQIPCASKDLCVDIDNSNLTIKSAKDIEIGTVLAIETAFATNINDSFRQCHYCKRLELNLIPCISCCSTMFCNNECKVNAINEYHLFECEIIEFMESFNVHMGQLAVQAILKIKQRCQSWDEFINISNHLGKDLITKNTINDIFNEQNKISLSSCSNDKLNKAGAIFNFAGAAAGLLLHLLKLPNYFPSDPNLKNSAIKAIVKQFLHLTMFGLPFKLAIPAVTIPEKGHKKIYIEKTYLLGCFSFIGKLKNDCNPNVLLVALKNKAAIIAIQPIKQGENLTISRLHHFHEAKHDNRAFSMYSMYHKVCKCLVCEENWGTAPVRELTPNTEGLTKQQLNILKNLNLDKIRMEVNNLENIANNFSTICSAMTLFNNYPYTDIYRRLFNDFKNCINYFQCLYINNTSIENVPVDFEMFKLESFPSQCRIVNLAGQEIWKLK